MTEVDGIVFYLKLLAILVVLLLGLSLVLASPVLIALNQSKRVTRKRFPNDYPLLDVEKETAELEPVVPVVAPIVNVVVETPRSLPYEHPGKRKPGDHELDGFGDVLRGKVDAALKDIFSREGEMVWVAGHVEEVQVFKTKKLEDMANVAITDPSGGSQITMYPVTWAATPVDRGDIVLLKGKIHEGKILVNSLEVVGEVPFGSCSFK